MRDKAQAIIEFVLVIIPFFIVLFGILQIIHIFIVKIIVTHAAFMTARVSIVDDRIDNIRMAAINNIPFKDKNNIELRLIKSNNDSELEISLIYNLKMIFPFINKIIKEYKKLVNYYYPVEGSCILPKENFID